MAVQVIMLFLTGSVNSLLVLFASLVASFATEGIYSISLPTKKFLWQSSLLRGLVTGLLLPSTYQPFGVFMICFLSLVISKYMLKGKGNSFASSWVNPAAICVAACYLGGATAFPPIALTPDLLHEQNAALALIQTGEFPRLAIDSAITSRLNKFLFSRFGLSVPDGYVSLFWDSGSIIPAFRFNFIILICSILLISANIVDGIIPATFLAVYLILVRLFGQTFCGGLFARGDIFLAMLTSGTLFCAFFLLDWPGTTPTTKVGKIFYAIFAGVLAFFIVGVGTSSAGAVFTVLVTNVLSTIIQSVEKEQEMIFTRNLISKSLASYQEGGENDFGR